MNKEVMETQAKAIASRLNDLSGLGFYCLAIKRLGFQKCYELSSLTLLMAREGKLSSSVGQYFNGCVMREIKERRLCWRRPKK